MNWIMCVDNSGSTEDSTAYWTKVWNVYCRRKPYKLIFWNSYAKVQNEFKVYSTGGTEPVTFLKILQNETAMYNLIITTDGEISDESIQECSELLTPEVQSLINSTTIYYIGQESRMNIGLNVAFGRIKHVKYHINDDSYLPYEKLDNLNIDEFMSPNFSVSLIMKIKNIELTYPDKTDQEARLAELRGEVCRLYSKLEHDTLDNSSDEKLESYYQNNQAKEFVDVLKQDRMRVMTVNEKKSTMLNLFDSKIDLNISRISQAPPIAEQDIEIPETEEDNAWSELEDVITMDKFTLPCLLVQDTKDPVITDNTILKHPFKLLSQPELVKKILQLIEHHPIDYSTYQKLPLDRRGGTSSPHTRAYCRGVFLLEANDMKCVKNNCRAISALFGNQNKVPGNLVLWNLIVTYLLYKHKFQDSEYQTPILEQMLAYLKKLSVSLSFTHQCQIVRRMRLEVSLWYCVQAAPKVCPNTALNVLRSTFGLELLQFYLDVVGREPDTYLEELLHRTRKWAVWNYLVVNKGRPGLDLEVKAQYQNYCIHKDQIILLPGKCETRFPSPCNMIDADSVVTMYDSLGPSSCKLTDIDQFQQKKAVADCDDVLGICDKLDHVVININTCWPHVICPVTKLHWKKCMGEYDLKSESHVRMFHRYCVKYKKYPEDYKDLVLLFSKKMNNCIITTRCIENFKYIFGLFKNVMNKYSCEKYLEIYREHAEETLRLSKE